MVLWALFVLLLCPGFTLPELIVHTPLGSVRGKKYSLHSGGVVGGFLGLPYAQPPINDLRFRPPMEIGSWGDGILEGTDFGAICFQPGEQKIWDVVRSKSGRGVMRKRKLEAYNISEDCLTLNIYVPLVGNGSVSSGAALPTLVYVHGGSYYMNAGRLYPGEIIANSQGIVVVTFNYRLGAFGFLSTEDPVASGNYGLLDQVAVLQFVQEYIHFFGGDRDRVTLVGNSAGAASVMFHLFSDLSRGKFIGVTVQSGCSGAPWAMQQNPRKHAEALAAKLGCPTEPTTDLVNCIRTFSPQLIMKNTKLEDGLSLTFATVIDGKFGGKFLTGDPQSLIKSKAFTPVPILTGFTRDEVTIWFSTFGPTMKTKDLRSIVEVDVVSLLKNLPNVTPANMAAMIHAVTVQYLYRTGIGENDTVGKTSAVSDFISDVGLKAPCIKEMNLLSLHTSAPIFLYDFHYYSVDDVKTSKQEWIGAYHESELQYIFGEPYLNYTNHLRSYDDKKMSDLLQTVWGNFVKYGTPTPSEGSSPGLKFNWPNYTEYSQDFVVLSLKSHPQKFFLTDRMLFCNFFYPIFRDYSFRFEGERDCGEWGRLKDLPVFWVLLSSTILLATLLIILLSCQLRRKLRGSKNHPPNNLPLVPR